MEFVGVEMFFKGAAEIHNPIVRDRTGDEYFVHALQYARQILANKKVPPEFFRRHRITHCRSILCLPKMFFFAILRTAELRYGSIQIRTMRFGAQEHQAL